MEMIAAVTSRPRVRLQRESKFLLPVLSGVVLSSVMLCCVPDLYCAMLVTLCFMFFIVFACHCVLNVYVTVLF